MVLTALRGALGFLSRLPVGRDERAWRAFRSTPAAFPLAGYVVGGLVALPLLAAHLLSLPAPTAALLFVLGVYLVTGINHVDGAADLGDALVVHGGPERRREVMADTTVGVGAALAVALVVLGLGTAGLALVELPARAALLVVAAEVGAKAGVAALVCLDSAAHEGFGSAFASRSPPRAALAPALVALPAGLLAPPAGAVALFAAAAAALAVRLWSLRNLGGISGDVLGATNELARVAALHAGAVAWRAVESGAWATSAGLLEAAGAGLWGSIA